MLGSAKQVIITKEDTIIMGGGGSKEEVNERVEQIQQQMIAVTSEYDREKL